MRALALAMASAWVLVGSVQLAAADEPAPAAATDPPALEARFQQALSDFAAGRFAEAAAGFEEVAAKSVDPARRTTAAEMGRQARARAGEPPSAPVPPPATPYAPATPPPEDAKLTPQSRDGRYVQLIGTTLMGLGLYGPTLPVIADSNDKTSVGLYMLGAGASFFVPYLVTRDRSVTWGMTDAWWHASAYGAVHGALVLRLANDSPSERAILATISLSSLIEGAGATIWAQQTNASSGLTNIMGKGSDFGMFFGFGLSLLAMPDLPDSGANEEILLGSGLVGAGGGYVLGWMYAQHRELTWGDGEVMRTTGILGAYVAAVPLILTESENFRLDVGVVLAGATLGLYAGDQLLDGRDFSAGQGVVVELSSLAGVLAGAGLGYLVSPSDSSSSDDNTAQSKIIATGAVLGGVGGFALAYLGLDTRVRRPDGQAPPPLSLQLMPDLTPGRRGLTLAGSF